MQLSQLVCKEVMRETINEQQSSVLAYFIQAAKVKVLIGGQYSLTSFLLFFFSSQSCLELKNYEAVFALVEGLESGEVRRAENSWQVRDMTALHPPSTVRPCWWKCVHADGDRAAEGGIQWTEGGGLTRT